MSEKTFDATSTASDVIAGHDLTNYVAIVTGGASGIGTETVRTLAKAGACVIIATRDLAKCKQVADTLKKETGSNSIEAEELDLTSLKSVHEFSKRFLATKRPLHLLVNNAGIMACPLSYTSDGFEMQIGTNHLGHFALTLDLLPALREGVKQSGKNVRVINVSSLAHIRSDVIFDDIHFKKTEYEPFVSYGQSKTANILFSIGLTKRFAKDGIYSNALMPGVIRTNLQRTMTIEQKKQFGMNDADGKEIENNSKFKSIEQGAATTIWACVAAELEGRGGLYLENCSISPIRDYNDIMAEYMTGKTPIGVVAYAMDEKSADRLWTISEKEIGFK